MSDGRCVRCGAPRWRGPNGTNGHLTMCEGCQRQYWRDAKTPRERQQRVRRDEQARRNVRTQEGLDMANSSVDAGGGRNWLVPEVSEYDLAVRSDLMRLYYSRSQGDRYLPAPLVHTADELLRRGWIAPVGHGYVLTEAGVSAWAGMVAPLTEAQRNPAMNELRVKAGLPLIFRRHIAPQHLIMLRRLVEEGCLPAGEYDERRHRTLIIYRFIIVGEEQITITAAGRVAYETFSQGEIMKNNHVPKELMDWLLMLSDTEWTATADLPRINVVIRTRAQRVGLVEGQGKTNKREYRLTEAGKQAMMTGELPVAWGGHNKGVETPLPLRERIKPYTPESPANGRVVELANGRVIELDDDECAEAGATCETCVYRQALGILAAQTPAIMQLVEALEAIKGL